jgi:hemoglobin
MHKRHDITDRQHVQILIDKFYAKVLKDDLLAPVFGAVDWEHHTPRIIDFWCMVLLGDQTYKGNPFQKHTSLSISTDHFNRWLDLFFKTIDENFEGEVAKQARLRAKNIADIFQFKLGLIG